MSQENVEVVRAFFEAWNAGNTDAVVELVDADVDYFPSPKLPEARPCHGPEEVLQFIARYLDAYSRHEWAIQEVIEVGGDRLLARVNLRVEGRDSGVKLKGDLYHCFWLRDGRFFRVEDHLTLSGPSMRSGSKAKRSKPWACRSKTLTPTPEPCGCTARRQPTLRCSRNDFPAVRRPLIRARTAATASKPTPGFEPGTPSLRVTF